MRRVAVHVDARLPLRPISGADMDRMVQAGILGEEDRVELLEGALVEMSPQSEAHAYALRRLIALAAPVAAAAGLELAVQSPLMVASPISRPEPDLAIVPPAPRERHPSGAVLVVEIGIGSRGIDLGPKAAVYAAAGIPDYWMLDVESRTLVVHREPDGDRFAHVERLPDDATATALSVPLNVAVAALL